MLEKINITGQKFYAPIEGTIEYYLKDKRYKLDRYEFSILKKGKFKSDFLYLLFFTFIGVVAGPLLIIVGKIVAAIREKNQLPIIDSWEIWALCLGLIILFLLGLILKIRNSKYFRWLIFETNEEKEFNDIRGLIDQHFKNSQNKEMYLISKKKDSE
jgi:hypothetical protein